jgi:hypothetical protein
MCLSEDEGIRILTVECFTCTVHIFTGVLSSTLYLTRLPFDNLAPFRLLVLFAIWTCFGIHASFIVFRDPFEGEIYRVRAEL